MQSEGLSTFSLFAIVYSIVVEALIYQAYTKLVNRIRGRRGFLLMACLSLTMRVFVPSVLVIYVEGSSPASLGLYLSLSALVFPAIIIAFLVTQSLSVIEDIYRVKYLGEDPWTLIKLYTPRSYKMELVSQLTLSGLPEEFLYRGYFLSRLVMTFGPVLGAVASSIYFGIVHMWSIVRGRQVGDMLKALRTFINGMIYAALFIWFGLIPCIVVHVSGNLSCGWISKKVLVGLGLVSSAQEFGQRTQSRGNGVSSALVTDIRPT